MSPVRSCLKEEEKKNQIRERISMVGAEKVFEWNWKHQLTDEELVANLQSLRSSLDNVQFSGSNDRWEWAADSNGEFSVKSVKRSLYSDTGGFSGYVMEWIKWVPAKVNIHSWRMELNRIPTREVLKKRNILAGDSFCPFCGSDEESIDHLFIACFVAANVWNGISTWCNLPHIFAFSIKDLLEVHKSIGTSEKKKEAVQGIVRIVCWSIWKARNNFIFSNIPFRIEKFISEVKALGFIWFANRSKHRNIGWVEWNSFVNM